MFTLLTETLSRINAFWRRSEEKYLVLAGLGLIAALGRVIQLGGFGEISTFLNSTLEVIIESARVILFLYVLGLANVKKGVLRIKHLITQQENRKQNWLIASQKVKKQWFSILLNLIAFLLIAWTLNYLIDLLAYETCLYLTLKKGGILSNSASEWTILLFFKNLSVIPFTLVFDAVFLLWITNRFQVNNTLQA